MLPRAPSGDEVGRGKEAEHHEPVGADATEDGGEFEYVEGILGLESVNDELVQTFILVAFDENDKAMSLGEDANGNKYYGLERWRPRKKIVDAISPLTLNNATAVDTYLDALFT